MQACIVEMERVEAHGDHEEGRSDSTALRVYGKGPGMESSILH